MSPLCLPIPPSGLIIMVNIILSSRAPKLGPELCQFIRKVYRTIGKAHKILLLCYKEQVESLDKLLWQYPIDYFLPHSTLDCRLKVFAEVLITSAWDVPYNDFVLINLTHRVHQFYYTFFIIIDLVGPALAALNIAKKNTYLINSRLSERSLRKLNRSGP